MCSHEIALTIVEASGRRHVECKTNPETIPPTIGTLALEHVAGWGLPSKRRRNGPDNRIDRNDQHDSTGLSDT